MRRSNRHIQSKITGPLLTQEQGTVSNFRHSSLYWKQIAKLNMRYLPIEQRSMRNTNLVKARVRSPPESHHPAGLGLPPSWLPAKLRAPLPPWLNPGRWPGQVGARRQQQHRHFASPGKEGVQQWPMRKWSRRRQAGRPSRGGGGGGGGTPAVAREGQATADLRDELVRCVIL